MGIVVLVEVGGCKVDRVDPVQKGLVLVLHHLPNIVVIFNPVPVATCEHAILIAADRVGEHCDEFQIL